MMIDKSDSYSPLSTYNIVDIIKEDIESGDKHVMNELNEALKTVSKNFDTKYETNKMRIKNLEESHMSTSDSLHRVIESNNTFKNEVQNFYLKWFIFCTIHSITIAILFYLILR